MSIFKGALSQGSLSLVQSTTVKSIIDFKHNFKSILLIPIISTNNIEPFEIRSSSDVILHHYKKGVKYAGWT